MTRRALFVPELVQTSAMDCGPAALGALLRGFGITVSYGRLREACQTDVDGTSIDTLEDLAVQLGLEAEQVMMPLDHVLRSDSAALPAIAVVRLPNGFTHFVLIWRCHGPWVQCMDPAGGRRWVTRRRLLDELYTHAMPVPAEAFHDYASSPEFLGALRSRMGELGVSAARREAAITRALAGGGWRPLAALDAATRMVGALVDSGGVGRGREASAVLERLFLRTLEEPDRAEVVPAEVHAEVVPAEYWSALPHDDEHVIFRGAVLVRASSARAAGRDEGLPPDLAAALRERPERAAARLWAILREDGLLAPMAVLLAIVLGALGVVVEGLVFRGAIELSDLLALPEQRIGIGLALVVFLVGLLALEAPRLAMSLRLGRHLEARLRVALLTKIPRLADRYFHSRLTSDMAERAHALRALHALPSIASGALASLFALLATSAGVICLDPARGASVLAVVALSVALPLVSTPLLDERDLRVQTHFGALTRFYLDALLGVVPLRTHGAARALTREHEGRLVDWERASRSLLSTLVSTEVVLAGSGVALTAGLLFAYVEGGGAPAGALLLVYWALRIPALGQQLAQSARQYPHLRNVTLRLLEPLGAPEEPTGEAPAGAPRTSAVALSFEDVTVRAGGHALLEAVSLTIAPGARVAIVGPSGAGKSTLVGLLLGWHRPAAGRVLVDGELLEPSALRRDTAWVDPSVALWNRSLLRNLRYGSDESRAPVSRVLEEAELLEVIERLPEGLSTTLGEGGARVSGGEGQRVRLGRAMMRDRARLAVLDEPFRGLDRGARRRLTRASLERFRGATVLLVTHDVAETRAFDRVLVIDGGRVVEDGAPEALLSDPASTYRRLLEADRGLADSTWGALRRVRLSGGAIVEETAS